MSPTTELAPAGLAPADEPRTLVQDLTRGDRNFQRIATAAAATTLAVMGLIALFLVVQAWPAISKAGFSFFTRFEWGPDDDPAIYGIASALGGTVVIALIALVLAVPVSIGTALFVNEYAPRWLRSPLVTVIDLLAAIPSIVFGLWGREFLNTPISNISRFLAEHVRFIPIFKTDALFFGNSYLVCGVVLSLMIVPIITSVSRSVMTEVPRGHCEAALALGGTRAGMIKSVVLPFSKGGLVGASMLGLGRALGETIAVALILSIDNRLLTNVVQPGGSAVAGLIAVKFPEASTNGRSALIGAGLALFIVTLIVNVGARRIVGRSGKAVRSGKAS
jgi:phosphate transport system permease protein